LAAIQHNRRVHQIAERNSVIGWGGAEAAVLDEIQLGLPDRLVEGDDGVVV
jgi:hypothetical protein